MCMLYDKFLRRFILQLSKYIYYLANFRFFLSFGVKLLKFKNIFLARSRLQKYVEYDSIIKRFFYTQSA